MTAVDYKTPLTKYERIVDCLSILAILLLFLYTAKHYFAMPETIPTDFNLTGEPDGWGNRWFIWLLPLSMLFTYVIMLLPDFLPA